MKPVFIKLTNLDGNSLYLETEVFKNGRMFLSTIGHKGKGVDCTAICLYNTDNEATGTVYVPETPEQILELIEKAK